MTFATLPNLSLGTPKPSQASKIVTHLTQRDRLRLHAALDAFALSIATHQKFGHLRQLSITVIGRMHTQTNIPMPPSANVGFWPSDNHHQITLQSTRLTALLRHLEPHLSTNALLVLPQTPRDHAALERTVAERAVLGRAYALPLQASAHMVLQATAWIAAMEEEMQAKTG